MSEDTEPDLELLAEKFKNYVEILAEADRTRCEEVYEYALVYLATSAKITASICCANFSGTTDCSW